MCHPVLQPDLLQLPPLQVFLPHLWAPHLTPAQWPPIQHKGFHPVAIPSTCIHVETIQTSGLSIFPKPPSPKNNYPSYKKVLILLLPPNTPIDAYIIATEQAFSKLPTQEADEFRSDINRLLKQQQQQHNNNCNLNPAQCRALTQLKQDNTRVVLTADKGVAMVIMDQQEYNNKAQTLLQDSNTYKVLNKDPTPNSKTNSSPYSKTSNSQEASAPKNTNNSTPQLQSHPSFMAYPKFTKQVLPLGP